MLPGHEGPWREWREAMGGARMHHGWILAGKRGLSKKNFAAAAAAELVGGTDAHPDIHTLTHLPKDDKEEKKRADGKPFELKRNITVTQIREMQRRLNTRPTMGERRVIIIDPADDLEKGASNALLKSLEEPPIGTFFLLVTHRPARLLPTIRSRCRVVRFPDLSPEQIAKVLSDEAPELEAATREAAISAANGSPGSALEFAEQGLARMSQIMRQIAQQGDPSFDLRGQLAGEVGARPKRERIQAILDLARAILAERMDTAERAEIPGLVSAHADLVTLAGQAPTFNFDPGLLVMEIGTLLARASSLSAAR